MAAAGLLVRQAETASSDATRDATDIALDREDVAAARDLLAELDEHAQAMDTATGTSIHTTEAAQRHQRLAGLTGPSS